MSTEDQDVRKAQPGRPRDPAKGDSILRAAAELLREGSYAELSIEAVAQRAGVSRPTVYRRYQNKADLVIEVVTSLGPPAGAYGDGGSPPQGRSLEEDLEALLEVLDQTFNAFVEQGVMPSFLADLILHPDLAKRFFAAYLDGVQQSIRRVFLAAAERGEIAGEPVSEIVFSALIGSYIYHRFVTVQDFGAEERRVLSHLVANGLIRR